MSPKGAFSPSFLAVPSTTTFLSPSFAMSADRAFFATGEMGKSPVIKVWDASSCLLLATLTSKGLKRGVTNLCFSGDGSRLCAVGNHDDHSHFIFADKGGRWSKVRGC